MTLAEIDRVFKSKTRAIETHDRRQASFDYILADLIGRSVSRIYNSSSKMPSLADAYPSLFSQEEANQKAKEKKEELSVLRFKQFAQSHNKKFKGVSINSE